MGERLVITWSSQTEWEGVKWFCLVEDREQWCGGWGGGGGGGCCTELSGSVKHEEICYYMWSD